MNKWHRMHKHFRDLESNSERLALAVKGFDERYPEANERLLPYVGWLNDPNTLAIRYEDVAGSNQDLVLSKIAKDYFQKTGQEVSVAPEKSHTFHNDGSGRWRGEMTILRYGPSVRELDYDRR